MEEEIKKLTCKHCGYSWYSKSQMIWITCPSCMNKSKQKEEGEDDTY